MYEQEQCSDDECQSAENRLIFTHWTVVDREAKPSANDRRTRDSAKSFLLYIISLQKLEHYILKVTKTVYKH